MNSTSIPSFAMIEHHPLFQRHQDTVGTLHAAVEKELFETIRYCLITTGISINARLEGKTPLYRACEKASRVMVEFLLRKGASVNKGYKFISYPDIAELPPLHVVIEQQNLELAALLVKHGAGIQSAETLKKDVLILSIQSRWEKGALFFLQQNIDLTTQVKDRAPYGELILAEAVLNGLENVVKELHKRGVRFGEVYTEPVCTLLHMAASSDDGRKLLPYLLTTAAGHHVNVQDGEKSTALGILVYHFGDDVGTLALAEALVNTKDFDITKQVYEGRPLLQAVAERKTKIEGDQEIPEEERAFQLTYFDGIESYLKLTENLTEPPQRNSFARQKGLKCKSKT